MSEQASTAGKPWHMKWWVWLIAALVVIGGIGALVNPEAPETTASDPTPSVPSSPEPTESEAPFEVIYDGNEAVNRFIVAFNETHPELALTSEDITVHRLGHGSKVVTYINDAKVIITEEALAHGPYGVSIYWDNPTRGEADANKLMFSILYEVLNPVLTQEEIDVRWQEVLDKHYVDWEDGTEVNPGTSSLSNVPGAFDYVKLYG